MNHERILKVADIIEANPDHFNMDHFYGSYGQHMYRDPMDATQVGITIDLTECGTTACIAGWACSLWGAEVDPNVGITDNADAILDLDERQGYDMYYNDKIEDSAQAAEYLRNLEKADT